MYIHYAGFMYGTSVMQATVRDTAMIVCDFDYCNIYRKLFKEYQAHIFYNIL